MNLNNLQFQKGSGDNHCQYPLTKEQLKNLKPCRLVNPRVGKNHGYKVSDFDINASTQDLLKVMQEISRDIFPRWFVEKHYPFKREFGEFPFEMPGPLKLEGLSFDKPKAIAEIVRMDMPMDLNRAIHRWVLSEGSNVAEWTPNFVNFLESTIDVQDYSTGLVKEALHKMFEIKYFFGVPRPEEIPVKGTPLGSVMTHYSEGSPCHPEAGHGHSAASAAGAKAIINKFPNLTQFQLKQILDSAYLFSIARCLARVHYGETVHIGLHLGGLGEYMKKNIVESIRK